MDESKRVTTTCPACSKQFRHWQSQPRKYCSKDCQYEDRTPGKWETIACADCGKPVRSLKTWPRKYCSRKCSGRLNTWNQREVASGRTEATCERCDKQFSTVRSKGSRFCSRRCFGEWQSERMKGIPLPAHVRQRSIEVRSVEVVVLYCSICVYPYAERVTVAPRRTCCSKKCANIRHGQIHSGENSCHWRGGYKPYYGPSWKPQRRLARARDKICQDCGKSPSHLGKALHVHHIQRFGDFGPERHLEANDLSNLICLCASCHCVRTRRGNPPPR